MRVLHVVEATIAGVRTHVQALATGLDQRRFQSAVACPLRRENAFGDERFVGCLADAGIPVLPVAMRRSISPIADLAALWRLAGIIRAGRFDIIHLHSSKAGFLGRLAARIVGSGAAVIYSPHGLSFLGADAAAERALYLSLERLAGRLCDRVVAVSPGERDLIVASGIAPAERVACIDLGVDTLPLQALDRAAQRRELGVPADAPLIGTVARVTNQKNPLLFVEAAARVLPAVPTAHFVWCGDGELRAEAERRAQALGIAARCHFLGHREDARPILASLDLFWLTSNYESFGLATAEAMALCLPVVATDVVGTRDVLAAGQAGVLVPPRDAAALAGATLSLLREPERMRELGQAGRARVHERYTLDRMLASTAALYESLAAPSAQARRAARGALER